MHAIYFNTVAKLAARLAFAALKFSSIEQTPKNQKFYLYTGKYGSEKTHILSYFMQ